MEIIDRSKAKATSCHYQLTHWVDSLSEIIFALIQLDRYHAPWMLKKSLGKYAVFVPGPKEGELPDEPKISE